MAKTPTDPSRCVYLKVTLKHLKPPIWRRLRVPVAWNLGRLSEAILRAMGWSGGHLHVFEIGGRQFGDPRMIEDGENERKMTLAKLIAAGVSRFDYVYDFGDDWRHELLIEAKPVPGGETGPGCVAGARACPPDDCGGAHGYEDLLAALAAPDTPESREVLEWFGEEEFDAEAFDLAEADRRMKPL